MDHMDDMLLAGTPVLEILKKHDVGLMTFLPPPAMG